MARKQDAAKIAAHLREQIARMEVLEQAVELRSDFGKFVRKSWPIVEPSMELINNWHLDALCDHLSAVANGKIRWLLINIGPGYAKSIIASVCFSAWMWARDPLTRMLAATYASSLTIRDNIRTRTLLESEWFQKTFVETLPEQRRWKFTKRNEDHLENDKMGFRLALSVDGAATGMRGDGQILDDLMNAKEAYSAAARLTARRFVFETMSSRFNDMRKGWRVAIGQRLHHEDPYGAMLETGDYEHLCLPSEFEPERRAVTSIGFTDPRKEAGELLFPELFNSEVIAQAKKDLGEYGFCTPGFTPILMSDWSEKRIEDIREGDSVIGYELGAARYDKIRLVPATVSAISKSVKSVVKITTASGREAFCTADHKWFRRKREATDCNAMVHIEYGPPRVGVRLSSVYTPPGDISAAQQRAFDWLESLRRSQETDHTITKIELVGEMPVYGLTTSTGNYVAWGFASQNSGQHQQRPSPAGGGVWKKHWFRYWQPQGAALPPIKVIMPDEKIVEVEAIHLPDLQERAQSWDCAFKRTNDTDFVVGQVWGRRGADRFLLDQVRERMNFSETVDAVRKLTRRHPGATAKFVEDKANGPAVISLLKQEIPGLIEVNPEGGKEARAQAVSPVIEAGNVYLPHPQLAPWIDSYLQECIEFPGSRHDDMVDATSQILTRWLRNVGDPKPLAKTILNPGYGASVIKTDFGGDRGWML